jgi:dTDP-4-dehydrorhamnose reductase
MSHERWIITGASGQLGSHVLYQLHPDDDATDICAWTRNGPVLRTRATTRRVDLADPAQIRHAVADWQPTHVLHLGALTAVGDCFRDPDRAERINVRGTATLAEAARNAGARLVFCSTDMVFDGTAAPYREFDPPTPSSQYGRTKVAAEQALLDGGFGVVARVPLMAGMPRTRRETTFTQQVAALRAGEPVRLFTDEFRTPVLLSDAARTLIGLARNSADGVIHVGGPDRLSRYDIIARCAEMLGLAAPNLVPISRHDIEAAEPRPEDLSLDCPLLHRRHPELVPGPLRGDMLIEP